MHIGKKQPIGVIRLQDGTEVDLHTMTDKPEELIQFKPKNSDLEDGIWLMLASVHGVVGAWSKCFIDWTTANADRIVALEKAAKARPDIAGNVQRAAIEVNFGTAGVEAYNACSDWKAKTDYLCDPKRTWKLSELGIFGEWMMEAGIDPSFVPFALRAHMED